jgi:5-methylcytosine-specific restriction protein A
MAVTKNPNWTEDEAILALDLYIRSGYRVLSGNHPDVVELSEFMNSLPIHPPELRTNKFRNPSGVNTKLANFRYVDPDRPGGLSGASRLDYIVWDEFAHDIPRLRKVVEAICRNYQQLEVEQEIDDPDESAPEGRVLLRLHKIRERKRTLVTKRKAQAIAEHGKLTCEACGFDFRATYGSVGDGYIECHHTVPMSELSPGHETKASDLALLCANCHRMVHRGKTTLTVEQLRDVLMRDV